MASTLPEQPSSPDQDPTRVREIKHIPTAQAYELWAEHYDSDGNFLQALDTLELQTLLPQFLTGVANSKSGLRSLKVVDLGCGTGRNTLQLLSLASSHNIKNIVGLDLSPAMLAIARGRIEKVQTPSEEPSVNLPSVQLAVHDISKPTAIEDIPAVAKDPDAVISTLVLEHLQLDQYFSVCAALIPVGGHLLITNMHSEQGAVSGAGFVDPATGTKMRAESFAHTIPEVVTSARRWGFEVQGELMEKGVDSEDLVQRLGSRSRKWFDLAVKTWFAVQFVRV